MELTNDFRVALPIEAAWAVLTDVERIAPCLPGAQLQEVDGDHYRGVAKVKVGPITASYKGEASFVSRSDEEHVAVLRAEGREVRGQGSASATITAALTADGDSTVVVVTTELSVTGKVAQFGRGVLAEVSGKLLDQFVDNLEAAVLGGDAEQEPDAPVPNASVPTRRLIDTPEPEPVDLLDVAGASVARRVAPIVAVALFLWLLKRALFRRG